MNIKAGDIIGFSGSSLVNDLINIGTWGIPRWHLSHVGIIVERNGELLFFESTSLAPAGVKCVIQDKEVKGVQAHTIETMLQRPGKIWLYPLSRPLYRRENQRLLFSLVSKCNTGKGYDLIGAGRAGGGLLRRCLS